MCSGRLLGYFFMCYQLSFRYIILSFMSCIASLFQSLYESICFFVDVVVHVVFVLFVGIAYFCVCQILHSIVL